MQQCAPSPVSTVISRESTAADSASVTYSDAPRRRVSESASLSDVSPVPSTHCANIVLAVPPTSYLNLPGATHVLGATHL